MTARAWALLNAAAMRSRRMNAPAQPRTGQATASPDLLLPAGSQAPHRSGSLAEPHSALACAAPRVRTAWLAARVQAERGRVAPDARRAPASWPRRQWERRARTPTVLASGSRRPRRPPARRQLRARHAAARRTAATQLRAGLAAGWLSLRALPQPRRRRDAPGCVGAAGCRSARTRGRGRVASPLARDLINTPANDLGPAELAAAAARAGGRVAAAQCRVIAGRGAAARVIR